ncbi:uroporphyrinogen decarboxylase [Bosea sp. (in: a-proteobacteria)]|uniref:uroporphyrinogen decarboxylase n=1 Tax=Bosea sp. (in: a-proteobacteria) TaxID=1871050 RepID=UPI001ACD463A|nr:uroporphyrinogen decarboxylase [Bosea sp. (in: a-proteobacteria)]MBN9437617.1 uroporphyrinogen decarboxylase [Bosea sp. (in: a-proteobacteria)]
MTNCLFLRALSGEKTTIPPLWLMRQAGRYLPEYREVRSKAGGFLELCYNPAFATEVTLQPIRRFGFDAAILFSDILVVPHALGQKVWFAEGEGPKLEALADAGDLAKLDEELNPERLAPVFETVERVRAALPAETALIGFCGAPWTVASYMLAGKGTPDQAPARLVAYSDPVFLDRLIERLIEASIVYLNRQIDAGAQVVQVFESFASALPPGLIEKLSFTPLRRIVAGVKAKHPQAKVILFARGAGPRLEGLAQSSGADGIGLDWGVDPRWAAATLNPEVTLQGNLDPLALIAGGEALQRDVAAIREAMSERPFIFNLGHGIQPQTPVAHVEQLVKLVRS